MRKVERFEAHLDDYSTLTAYVSKNFYQGRSDAFYLRDAKGHLSKCDIFSYEQSGSEYFSYTLGLKTKITIGETYELLEEHGLSVPVQYSLITKTDRFDEEFYYEGDDLGCHPSDKETSFALWAPTAHRVVLELFDVEGVVALECTRGDKGVFRTSITGNRHGISYLYHIYVNGKWTVSTDPVARSSLTNNQRSVVVDYTQLKVEKIKPKTQLKSPTEAILYELSVRDFTMQEESRVSHRGQFLGLTEKDTKTSKGTLTGLAHIVDLGVTHVQIMPMYDFATVDEHNVSLFYNWGYDPLQYNVPEGSFSTHPDDPMSRVKEAMMMVQSFHKEDIKVIMDVVYNHVYDMETSPFEKVVPYYYFRRSSSGSLSNGSFCGNDFDSNRKMARKFILDSVACWMEAYDVDGFRFDLMGVLDVETMNAVVKQARALKPDALIYGEGWNMPTALPEDMKANKGNQHRMPEIGQFNDFFRDIVKGKTSNEEINIKGYCTGDTYQIEAMKACMLGTAMDGYVRTVMNPSQSINYVECHDNHTSWDKMKESNKEDSREVRVKRQKLMIGTILMAQGIPFIHSGQEFARTKNGIHNTYRSPDNINQIDWLRKERFMDIVSYTKEMIALRKRLPILQFAHSEDLQGKVDFRNFDGMLITHYTCPKAKPYTDLWIYINPTDQIYYESFPDFVMIIANEAGIIDNVRVQNATINPYTLVVFAKEASATH